MISYCLKCRRKQKLKTRGLQKQNKGILMLLSKCAVCGSKKSIFIKEQKAGRIIGSLLKSLN